MATAEETTIRLNDVYDENGIPYVSSVTLLYELLAERDETVNIAHRALPSFTAHASFVASRPYASWRIIQNRKRAVGAIYVTKSGEIGLFIFKAEQGKGYGTTALRKLLAEHPGREYLANINVLNARSQKLFAQFGFAPVSQTYRRAPA